MKVKFNLFSKDTDEYSGTVEYEVKEQAPGRSVGANVMRLLAQAYEGNEVVQVKEEK